MPRHICIIRPDIWTDEDFQQLSCRAKLLWLGLAGFLDCEGRALFDPDRLVAEIFPGQAVNVSDLSEELQIMEMIDLYQVDGVTYIQMAGFARHQRRDKRRVSRLPDREGMVAAPVARKTGEGMKEERMRGEGTKEEGTKEEKTMPPAGGEPPRASGSSDGEDGIPSGPTGGRTAPHLPPPSPVNPGRVPLLSG